MFSRRLCSSIGWKFAEYYDAYLLWLLMPSTCQWLLIWNSQRKIDGNLIHRLEPVIRTHAPFQRDFWKIVNIDVCEIVINLMWILYDKRKYVRNWFSMTLISPVTMDSDNGCVSWRRSREFFFLLLRWTAFVFIQHFHRITHVSCFQLTDVDVLWTREFNAQHGFLTI